MAEGGSADNENITFLTMNHTFVFSQTVHLFMCFAAQMAQLGFSMIPLFYSLSEQVTLWLRSQRVHMSRRKKPNEPLHHGQDSYLRPQSPELSALSTRPWRPAKMNHTQIKI